MSCPDCQRREEELAGAKRSYDAHLLAEQNTRETLTAQHEAAVTLLAEAGTRLAEAQREIERLRALALDTARDAGHVRGLLETAEAQVRALREAIQRIKKHAQNATDHQCLSELEDECDEALATS